MTKIEQVENFLETNVGIHVDAATPDRSHLPGAEGRKQRSMHAFNVHFRRNGAWSSEAGWVYISASALAA